MKLDIQENVKLAPYTTYKIGGTAKYFFVGKTEEKIAEAVGWARAQKIPFFVLGGGSNVLISDKGFAGLVVRIQNTKYKISPYGGSPEGRQNTKVEAEAGIDLPKLVKLTIDNGFKGLEWASGIPGTFGGAIRGNAGAFGGEIKDILLSIKFLDDKGEIREFANKQCNFSYRDSIFKQNPNFIVLSATLQLAPGNKKELQDFSRKTIEYRAARHPLEYGSCGSVFKAIDVGEIRLNNFEKYPRFKSSIKYDPFPVIPAACFIDEADLKGYSLGGAVISAKHPNFFVNFNKARAEDVIMLISLAKQRLVDKFGIMAEEEVQLVGF